MKNVAVIGFGFMGLTHALNIQKNKDLHLAAIITRHPETIEQKLTSQIGNFSSGEIDIDFIRNTPAYASLQECMQHIQLDAVHICVHTDLHYQLAMEAMDFGLHVLLEKPMSLDLQACQELITTAREKKVVLMVGHVLRFMPPYQQLKAWIDSREFGELQFISLTRFSGLPAWGQWKEKQESFGTSGGALFDLLIHDIDFLNAALGEPQYIDPQNLPGQLSKYDYVNAQWRYPDKNLTAQLAGGNVFHSTFPFQAGYMAAFEKASVVYTTLQPHIIQLSDNEKLWDVPAGDSNDGFYNEIAYFASCVENNAPPLQCPPESSLQAVELCYRHIPDESIRQA